MASVGKKKAALLEIEGEEVFQALDAELGVFQVHTKNGLIGEQLIFVSKGGAGFHPGDQFQLLGDFAVVGGDDAKLLFLNLDGIEDLLFQDGGLLRHVVVLRPLPLNVSLGGIAEVFVNGLAAQVIGRSLNARSGREGKKQKQKAWGGKKQKQIILVAVQE